jgi:hypothetical protein
MNKLGASMQCIALAEEWYRMLQEDRIKEEEGTAR